MTKHDAERKRRILDYIAATLRARGYPPSVREIAQAVGPRLDLGRSPPSHRSSRREGYLERGAARSRAIRLTPTAALHLGLSSELVPQQAVQPKPTSCRSWARSPQADRSRPTRRSARRWPIPDLLAPSGDAYVLRVRGDSMIEAHIEDGDYVVIRPQQTARNGDIVVAQVEENAVTLKRFFKEQGRIRLQPANPAYPPQYYPDVRIQGKLIGVIRRLD